MHLEINPTFIEFEGTWYRLACNECHANCGEDGKFFRYLRDLFHHIEEEHELFVTDKLDYERFNECTTEVSEEEVRRVEEKVTTVERKVLRKHDGKLLERRLWIYIADLS